MKPATANMHWVIWHSHSQPPHELLRNQNESLNTWTSSRVNSWQTRHHTDVVSAEKESSQLNSDCRARCDSTASHGSPPAAPLSPELFWGAMERWLCFISDCVIPQSCFVSRLCPAHGLLGGWKIRVPWCSVVLKSPMLHEEQWWQTQPPGWEKRPRNRYRDAKRAWF